MGDAQSAQREGMKDEAGEEESGKVDDAQAEQSPEDKPFKNNGQISEISEKAGSSIAKVNDHCEDEIATDAVLTPDEEVSETENPLEVEEETPSKHIEKNEIESSNEADVAEDVPLDMIEMDAKTNDINDGFRRFFSNIGLRLSIKRGSTDLLRDLPDETNQDEPSGQENLEDSAEELPIEDAEQNTDVNIAQVSTDNDSTTCPTMTDVTPEDVLENAEEKATEAKEDVESDNADSITSPAVEDTQQDTTPEEEPNSLSPPEQADVVSPIKRFFTTGIFSGLRKKRKAVEDDVNEKEMVDMGKNEAVELAEETEYDQQEDKEQIDRGVEAAVVDTEVKENELKQEILSVTSAKKADEGKSPTTDHSTAIDTTTIFPESETPNSQEKDKVQASPLKRLLSGSSFKKLSKKPRSRRSSDAKLSDSGEHAADQLLSSTESTENQKEEKSTQPSPEAAGQEDGAWVSFKKLLTPKKHTRTPSLSNKETEIPDSGEEPKPSDGEQISDHSTEEGKKRKDSSVSWEAVLCGSGKKRSRKTSDSEDESPQIDDNKQDIGSKNGAELPEESANEKKNDVSVSSPKQSPLIGDGGSTWKSFKRLVTPKRKAKDEDESKDNIQSDSEVSQDESSFSIKKLLPGRKKRKSAEKQDHISSDEADKDVPSDDEDSETPAVVPMSEFDTPESVIQIQTQVDIESHFPKEVPQDLVQQMPKQILSCDSLQNEAKKLKENGDAVDNGTSTIPAKIEQLDDVSEIISKHQQLSDITEEGMITETMATPVSINEEVGRDDTLAEDLLEITSEAITAPEPASVTTLADETEMISAVSQLSSESSKTSGNTTPVPAEYEVKETEELLHQVVENISTSPMAVPISSTTPKSESIVGSVLHHIFRTFVKEDKETTILEIHRKSDATAINTGQTAEELDAVNEVRATAQTESISEVNDSDPKEFLPDVREKLDTAEITKDEVHEDHPIDPEQSLKELERINEIENDSHHQDESQLDANAAGSVVESLQAEMETPKMGTEDPPSKEFKEETELPREVKVEPEKVDESYTDACKTEYVQLPDAIKGVQATMNPNQKLKWGMSRNKNYQMKL
ncbi:A-kinase anchor protein 12 [Labrus mixtus]|uniref:A-kinase anchor protein 12 n=1 Tax=Labrus mixtus TaxID=508554 RepID=UPI0029C05CCE|nr:A-kinase anchor protein 12 [Labrus mixtus]